MAATVIKERMLMLEKACSFSLGVAVFFFVRIRTPPYFKSMEAVYQSTADRLSSGTKYRICVPL